LISGAFSSPKAGDKEIMTAAATNKTRSRQADFENHIESPFKMLPQGVQMPVPE
jgi:hypothetical protein